MHPQHLREPEQVAEFHLFPSLHPLQRIARQAGVLTEALLSPAQVYAANADAVAHVPAGRSDPVRMMGHLVNAGWKLILCQPQKWGIFRS